MQHLTEERLVMHFYRDDDATAESEQHLASCAECRAQFDAIRGVLALVEAMPVPERSDGYGDEVWTRLRWKLGSERRRSGMWGTLVALAAGLAIAFAGGMLWHARTQRLQQPTTTVAQTVRPVSASTPTVSTPAQKDRLLLIVVSDHLDSSERMLLEVSNADPKHSLDVSSESRRAGELVASNRIYRQTATQRGETRIASLLSDLEPVLVELSHAGSTLSPDEVAALQKRIDSKGLLFKVRVVSAQASGHEAPAAVKGMDSL